MRLLLDSHAFLWFANDDRQLSSHARRALENSANPILLSVASFWEMAIKFGLGKLRLQPSFEEFMAANLPNGFQILPITFQHTVVYSKLPLHHRDPFDRMLIAQAIADDLTIVTGNAAFRKYRVKRVW